MTEQIFSEARRSFETLPGVGMMEFTITKLARAGVDPFRIRGWALDISEEFGISAYVGPSLDRLMRDAVKLAQAEER